MPQTAPSSFRIFPQTVLTDDRDPETIGHVERVCAYAGILARSLSNHRRFQRTVDVSFIRRLTVAAALHDTGKASIPPAILHKPGPLNDRETSVVQQHTSLGAEAVRKMLRDHVDADFREMAVEIALTHHERWDGAGYPNRLAGNAIPISGRIVALADVYDALTSKRIYKDAFSHKEARNVIVTDRGSHFDPAVVDAFIASESAMMETATDYAERTRASKVA